MSGVPLGCIEKSALSACVRNPTLSYFVSDCEQKHYPDNLCVLNALGSNYKEALRLRLNGLHGNTSNR